MYKYKCENGHLVAHMAVESKLAYMPYAKAGVTGSLTHGLVMYSYCTDVIHIDKDGWLTCTGTYSQTTRRHISAFVREYAPHFSYYDAKDAYEKRHKLNIYTGEIVPL